MRFQSGRIHSFLRRCSPRQKVAHGLFLGLLSVPLLGGGAFAAPGQRELPLESHAYLWEGSSIKISLIPKDQEHSGRGTERAKTVSVSKDRVSELDFDLNGDGVVDIRELSAPPYLFRLSLPSSEGYLNLQIEKKLAHGTVFSEFVLSRDGSRYERMERKFVPFREFHMSAGGDGSDCDATARGGGPGENNPSIVVDGAIASQLSLDSAMDRSCKNPPLGHDYQKLLSDLSRVMGPRRGALASCMTTHHLGYYAGKMDDDFDKMLGERGAQPTQPEINCKQVDYPVLGSFSEEHGTISIDRIRGSGAPADFGEIFFHESLHKAGIADEALVLKIVACCYQGQDSAACQGVDANMKVNDDHRANLTSFFRNLDGFKNLWGSIEKNSDPETAGVILDGYLSEFVGMGKNSGAFFEDCKKSGGTDKACSSQALSQALGHVTQYIDQNCKRYFGASSQSTRVCQSLQQQTVSVLTENATHACPSFAAHGGKGVGIDAVGVEVSRFQDSCLMKAEEDAKKINDQLWKETPGDYEKEIQPIYTADFHSPKNVERVHVLNSYLTAFKNYAGGGVLGIVADMKKALGPNLAEAMMEAWFKNLKDTSPQSSFYPFLKSCGQTQACGDRLKAQIDQSIQSFFKTTCPRYFQPQADSTSCANYAGQFQSLLDDQLNRGCPGAPQSQGLSAGKYQFGCLAQTLDQAKSYDQNYAALEKTPGFEMVDGTAEQWKYATYSEKNQAQASALDTPSNTAGSLASGVRVFSFDDPDDMGAVTQWVRSQPPLSVPQLVSQAARAMGNAASDVVVPEAQAGAAPPSVARDVFGAGAEAPVQASKAVSPQGDPSKTHLSSNSDTGSGSSPGSDSDPAAPYGAGTRSASSARSVPAEKSNPQVGAQNRSPSQNSIDAWDPGARASAADDNDGTSSGIKLVLAGPAAPPIDDEIQKISLEADTLLRELDDPAQREGGISRFKVSPIARRILVIDCGVRLGSRDPWVVLKRKCNATRFDKSVLTQAGWFMETPGGMVWE